MPEVPDPYAVLQVEPAADQEVIQAAYRALARRYHPDLSNDPSAANRMAEINAAWEVLGDPARRAAYDGARKPNGGQSAAASGSNGHAAGSSAGFAGRAHNGATRPGASSAWRIGPDGEGAAGPPPGRPYGSVLDFGRHIGWSLGEIARVDPGYLEWLVQTPRGGRYRDEVQQVLQRKAAGEPDRPMGGGPKARRGMGFLGR